MRFHAAAARRPLLLALALLGLFLAGQALAQKDENAAFEESVASYESGDYEKAARQYGALAAKGHVSAQFNLANMYHAGEGVERSPELAARWFRAAAEQGHAGAQNALGVLYAMGQGVEQSDVEAYAWFNVAAAQGNEIAQKNAARADRIISKAHRAMAEQMAAQYYQLYVEPLPATDP